MSKKIFLFPFVCLSVFVFSNGKSQQNASDHSSSDTIKGYKLVWADEFNEDGAPEMYVPLPIPQTEVDKNAAAGQINGW